MNIFLGEPPANIKQWIIDHYTPPTPPASGPLCFTAEQDGSSVSLIGYDNDMFEQIDIFASLQCSTDNSTWQEWDGHVINLNAGQKVYIKALNPNPNGMAKDYGMKYHNFIFEGKIAASGNIQYLLEDTGSRTDVPAYAYYDLFDSVIVLTQAPALPATTLADYCYYNMFRNCKSLAQAPALPATTLADYCYENMFQDCTSLTQAPALPATILAYECYYNMFNNCTSLAHAPALPATTLADSCYFSMFYDCTSLTQAPALPATILAVSCYESMFYDCTSLTQAPALPATTLDRGCYESMFYGCSKFSECHMKASMEGVYNTSAHGDTKKTVVYDL